MLIDCGKTGRHQIFMMCATCHCIIDDTFVSITVEKIDGEKGTLESAATGQLMLRIVGLTSEADDYQVIFDQDKNKKRVICFKEQCALQTHK